MKVRTSLLVALVALASCADPPPAAPPPPPLPIAALPPSPPPDPAPTTDGDVTVAFSQGLEILVKRTPGAEFVAGELFLRGGSRNWSSANAGVEDLALQVATQGGTRSLPKEAFTRKLASLGARVHGSAGGDFSSIATKAPLAAWDAVFPVFVDTLLSPALPQSELDVVKQRELARLRHEMEDGDGRLWLLTRKMLFAGHPYLNRAGGSLESLGSLALGDLESHLVKLRDRSRLVLVVVGDVDPSHVIEQAKAAFASVPRGSYVETPMPPLRFTTAQLSGDPFKLPTNYVESVFGGPTWTDPDFPVLRLGMSLLGNRMFDEVRTKRNLSYAPNAYFDSWQGAPFSVLYVTAVDPTTTMQVMFDQVRRLGAEPVPKDELAGAKSVFLSSYVQQHETVDGQATELGYALLLGGDWHAAKAFADRIRSTTAEDIERVATKWLTNPQTAIVGDPTKLDAKVVGAAR